MKKYPNWENVEENGNFNSIKPGGYVAFIKNVDDDPNKECLKISYDIAEGEFKNYYMELYKAQNFWGGSFFRSYKESAIGFFKGFITSIENSNPGYKWDWNEKGLKGKYIGIVLQEEEYIPTQGKHVGEVRTRLIVQETHSIDKIRKGDYTVKDKKLLSQNQNTSSQKTFNENQSQSFGIVDDDIQF